FKYFNKILSIDEYSNFVKKFLKDPKYRKQFLVKSYNNWTGIIDFNNKRGVNKPCEEKIKILNKKSICSFNDLINLKTYGLDKASYLSLKELEKALDKDDVLAIKNRFSDYKHIVTAMRWNYRGLKLKHCIEKVEADIKQQNKYSKRF